MNIYLALCGNAYAESLARAHTNAADITLIHRSNVNLIREHILRILVLLFAMVLRYGILPINGRKFIILVPHVAGSYGFLMWLLRPHKNILIDDGITFEYWSKFHSEFILPLYLSPKTTLLLGPHQPNWYILNRKNIEFKLIERRRIVFDMIDDYKFLRPIDEKLEPKVSTGWLIDDGLMDKELIENLLKQMSLKYNCEKFMVLWHPARRMNNKINYSKRPAEASILYANANTRIVVGKASTTLFNLAELSSGINVVSFPSGYPDLDDAAQNCGIDIINFPENVEN